MGPVGPPAELVRSFVGSFVCSFPSPTRRRNWAFLKSSAFGGLREAVDEYEEDCDEFEGDVSDSQQQVMEAFEATRPETQLDETAVTVMTGVKWAILCRVRVRNKLLLFGEQDVRRPRATVASAGCCVSPRGTYCKSTQHTLGHQIWKWGSAHLRARDSG